MDRQKSFSKKQGYPLGGSLHRRTEKIGGKVRNRMEWLSRSGNQNEHQGVTWPGKGGLRRMKSVFGRMG